MNKKLVCAFFVLVAVFSCNSMKSPVALSKETGFQKSEGCFFEISDIERMGKDFDEENKDINIKNSHIFNNKSIIHWTGRTTDKDGRVLPFVNFYECDSTGFHYLKKSDEYGAFSIKTHNPYCEGFYLDCDHVEIKRGFALGEEELYVETHQVYETGNYIYWEGKTMDKNGKELPFVSFYEIDSTWNQKKGKYNESLVGFYLANSDENGFFKIRSRTKSCLGFFVYEAGYLGTIYYVSRLYPNNEKRNDVLMETRSDTNDFPCIEPKDLKYNRKGLIVRKGKREKAAMEGWIRAACGSIF